MIILIKLMHMYLEVAKAICSEMKQLPRNDDKQ